MSQNPMHVATLISNPLTPCLTPEIAEAAANAIGSNHVYWLADGIACDIIVPSPVDEQLVHQKLAAIIGDMPIDKIVQPQQNRRKKLLLADMDSTMIQQECIDELAEEVGLRDAVSDITRRAMNGEIAFEPALRERVALLKGLPLSIIDQVIDKRITLMPGGRELVQTMKKHGGYTALVSGGFTLFTTQIAEIIGFDENHANILLEENGALSGKVADPILGKQAKLDRLLALCAQLEITPDCAMAVGDGANDLDMLLAAGSGVALHAKPVVAQAAKMRIDHGDLTALLYLQGYRAHDFVH